VLAVDRRCRIVAIAVLVADPALAIVDHDLRALVLSDLACRVDRLLLGAVVRGVPAVALSTDAPPIRSLLAEPPSTGSTARKRPSFGS